jgi:hypothetical protein
MEQMYLGCCCYCMLLLLLLLLLPTALHRARDTSCALRKLQTFELLILVEDRLLQCLVETIIAIH